MYNFGFISYLSVFCCRKLNLKWIENDNSIALKRIGITEAHIGIPINMNEKPTLILINSCRHTMSDTYIELNLQSTILFTVHDFKQKSTAVFLHFKLLLCSPQFYFTVHNLIFTVHNFTLQSTILSYNPYICFSVHNFTLQSTILIYSPYIVNMWLENVILQYICVQTFTLLSIILLYSPQIYFAVHNISLQSTIFLQSTILIYSLYIVNIWLETVILLSIWLHTLTLQSTIFLCSPKNFFTVHNYTLQSTILLYSPQSSLTPDMFLQTTILQRNSKSQFSFRVHAFTINSITLQCDLYFPLQSTILLWTAQGFFELHKFTVGSTIVSRLISFLPRLIVATLKVLSFPDSRIISKALCGFSKYPQKLCEHWLWTNWILPTRILIGFWP